MVAFAVREAVFQFPNGASKEEWVEWWRRITDEVVGRKMLTFLFIYLLTCLSADRLSVIRRGRMLRFQLYFTLLSLLPSLPSMKKRRRRRRRR